MKPKILIADDSLTIQKVIKITLANEEYELVECLDDKSLIEKISTEKPSIVLLDFNLSESKVGYDLVKDIQSVSSAQIMMMYGTFDTVEESLLSNLGIEEHLVKPFDGNKFIASCRRMVEDSQLRMSSSSVSIPEKIEESAAVSEPVSAPEELSRNIFEADEEEDDQWVVNQPSVEVDEEIVSEKIITSAEMNQLEAGIQDWGMDIPNVIGDQSDNSIELPPVISANPIEPEEATAEDDSQLPASSDLEYPDMEVIRAEVEVEKPSIELTPLTELNAKPMEVEIEPNSLEPTQGEGTNTEEEVRLLEEQIADELEEEPEADLWGADEFVVENVAVNKVDEDIDLDTEEIVLDNKVDEIKETLQEFQEKETTPEIKAEAQLDTDFISQEQIKEMLTPMVEQMVKEHIQKSIDKIAWEVIPDLAENLIKKELKSITEQILNPES